MKCFFLSQRGLLLLALLATSGLTARAQGVGIGTTAPDASAALDIVSSAKGVLLPRVADATAIATPATGLLVFQTGGSAGFYYNAGTAAAPAWQPLASGASAILNQATQQAGSNFNISGNGTVGGLLTAANARVATALTGNGADIGPVVGVGIRADGGLNLGQNTPGNNVLLGFQAGQALGTGAQNEFVGYQSGLNTTTGYGNQFDGFRSGLNNTTGYNNQFSGYQSGYANTTGASNRFSGYQSGFSNTTGSNNQFSGIGSGYSNTTGGGNQFDGFGSGFYNTTGSANYFSGFQSGYRNTAGSNNVFSGTQSGQNNTTGSNNVFDGYGSGAGNTTGTNNAFVGYASGSVNTTGSGNVFVGFLSGYTNTTASANVFLGYATGITTTTGDYNVFSGSSSGYANTTGGHNLFSGANSGLLNTTGHANTALGDGAGPSTAALTNTTALGANATVATSNTIQLGDASITTLNCQVALTTTSDARFKYDVRANVPGLAFITRLRPVTYRFDQARLNRFEHTGMLVARSTRDTAAAVHTGFLAQDVERTAQALRYRFDGLHAPANARDHYGLGYAQFVVPLVQAVQEQQAQIEALQRQNAALQQQNAALQTGNAADHASLLTLQAQMARLLGDAAPAGAQARK